MAQFGEQRRKAFDFCADATKQLVTLSSAIIAFMVTFANDFVVNVSGDVKLYAYIAWTLHFAAIVFGIIVLLALTAQLEPKDATATAEPTIRGAPATYSFLQIAAFIVAMLFTGLFGYKAAHSVSAAASTEISLEQAKQLRHDAEAMKAAALASAKAHEVLQRKTSDLAAEVRKLRAQIKRQQSHTRGNTQ